MLQNTKKEESGIRRNLQFEVDEAVEENPDDSQPSDLIFDAGETDHRPAHALTI